MCFQKFIFVYFCALCLLLGYVQDLTSNFSDVLALTVFCILMNMWCICCMGPVFVSKVFYDVLSFVFCCNLLLCKYLMKPMQLYLQKHLICRQNWMSYCAVVVTSHFWVGTVCLPYYCHKYQILYHKLYLTYSPVEIFHKLCAKF